MGVIRTDQQNDVDLAALPGVLKRSAKPLLIASAAVGLLTYGGLLLVPSRYTSTAQITIGAKGRDSAGGGEIAALKVDREAIRSRVQELRSPDLARRLATELKLARRPEFNSAIDTSGLLGTLKQVTGIGGPRYGESEEERVLTAYFKALQVYEMKETRVIAISFSARDGVLAAKVPNRLIELYQERLRQQGSTETTDANAWLAPEIEKRTIELSKAEAAVERFRTEANLFRGGGGSEASGLAEQQLTDLTSELTKARGQRTEAEARARAARELVSRDSPDAIPDVQKSPVIQGLIAQRVRAERDLAEAAAQLLPAHPRMRQLSANVADIRRQVLREAKTIVEGLERETKVLGIREELAQKTLDEAKARIGDKAGDRVRLAQLEDEAKAKRRELAALRDRFEAARSRSTTKPVPVELQVIATARPTSLPSWPNRLQISALAAAATLVFGLVLILFRQLLATGNRAPEPSDRHALGLAPQTSHRHEPALVPAAAGRHPEAVPAPTMASIIAAREAAGAIRAATASAGTAAAKTGASGRMATEQAAARLLRNSAGQGGYRTVVVGQSDAVDARDEAVDIAASLAAAGRQVVLVDWGFDGEGIARALGINAQPGFTDLLAGTHTFDDVIRAVADGGVHILPRGSALVDPSGALEADRLNMMLDALDEAYADVVLTGSHSDVRQMFLAVEGRFDAGVIVSGEVSPVTPTGMPAGRFLGFDVTDIDIIHVKREAPYAPTSRRAARRAAAQTAGAGVATSAS